MGRNAKRKLRKQAQARLIMQAQLLADDADGLAEKRKLRGIPAVNGGFRAGKRKRGTSLLKVQPKQATHLRRFDVTDEDGNILALNAHTIIYRRADDA